MAESNTRRGRVRIPNSKYLGGDYVTSDIDLENNATVSTSKAQTSPKPRGAAENSSEAKPKWRQQWRRVPTPTIPQNQGKAVVSPVLPTMAPMEPSPTNSAMKPQATSNVTPKGH